MEKEIFDYPLKVGKYHLDRVMDALKGENEALFKLVNYVNQNWNMLPSELYIFAISLSPNNSKLLEYRQNYKQNYITRELDDKVKYILENPFDYGWELQGFGMLRTYIDKNTRLQIWLNDFIVPGVTDVHTHPWDFTSTIYQGSIINHVFVDHELTDKVEGGENYDRCLILTGENAYVKERTLVKLTNWSNLDYYRGDMYYHYKNAPHRIDFMDGTITILTKGNINPDNLAYSYTKPGEEWVSAAPRLATPEEINTFINAANNLRRERKNG